MKTELTTRINGIQENNDQKNSKYVDKMGHIEKLINIVEEEANKEIKYTRKLMDQLADKLT